MLKIFLFFFTNLAISQSLFIFDNETKKPIPFTNISYLKDESIIDGDYCNENGLFTIKKNINFDKIAFSCVGYETKVVNDISNIDTLYLIRKIILLDEIFLSKNKSNTFSILGYSKSKKKIGLSGGKGFEICVFIQNPYKEKKYIKSFLFKVRRKENYKTAIRVHYYKTKSNIIEPNEEILTEDIVRYFDGKTKEMVEIDVDGLGLELPPEGAFIGIEWLGIIDEKTGEFVEKKESWSDTSIGINDEINKPLTFIKNTAKKDTWNNTEKIKEELKEIVKFKNYPNASFGIKIY